MLAFLLGGLEFGSLDRLLPSFLSSQSSFGCIFKVFFYIFLFSKGDGWNSMKLILIWCWLSQKTKCLLQTRSLSSTILFIALLRITAEIHSFLLVVVSSSCSSPWFVKNPKPLCFPLFLEQLTTMHKTIPSFSHYLFFGYGLFTIEATSILKWLLLSYEKKDSTNREILAQLQ